MHAPGRGAEQEAAPVEQITARVDDERRGGHLRGRAGMAVAVETEQSRMPQDQSRGAPSVDASNCAQPERRRIKAAREFGHERNMRVDDDLADSLAFRGFAGQRQGAIERFAGRAGQFDRMQAEPLRA